MTVRHHEFIEVTGEIRHRTDLAVLFFDGDNSVWIPESLIEDEQQVKDNVVELLIPEWFAKKEDLI